MAGEGPAPSPSGRAPLLRLAGAAARGLGPHTLRIMSRIDRHRIAAAYYRHHPARRGVPRCRKPGNWRTTSEPPAELTARLTEAANALRLLCKAREQADGAFTRFAAAWGNKSADALIRKARTRSGTRAERIRAHFVAVRRLADDAVATLDHEPLGLPSNRSSSGRSGSCSSIT
jgi:hypothetical protein